MEILILSSNSHQYPNRLINLMNELGFSQNVNEYTTDSGTIIDLLFVNFELDKESCGALEAYYSYHRPIWFKHLS